MATTGDIVAGMTVLTSTAIMARLLVKREGLGYLLASVPEASAELAARLTEDSEMPGYHEFKLKRGRVFFMPAEPYPFIDDITVVDGPSMAQSRAALTEVLNRLSVSGLDLKPLSKLEFEYLQHWLGDGNWCRRIAYLEE